MQYQYDQVWLNANLFTMDLHGQPQTMTNGCIAVKDQTIAWVGQEQQLLTAPEELAAHVIDVKDAWITPGLIDCHTHVVYAGQRAAEYNMRLQGMDYAAIAKQGGGIQATVQATRNASEQQLLDASVPRVRAMLAQGVTTLEIKSGYGLDFVTERKLLRVAKHLARVLPVHVVTTFLGAHVPPPEYQATPDTYIDRVCHEFLPQLVDEQLVDAVDVFVDDIAFSVAQAQRVFQAASDYQLPIKCHAEQWSHQGIARCAAEHQAMSCDHLEYADEADIAAMAAHGCVAVLLPGAYYFLQARQRPPIHDLRRYQVPIALATDCNPGSSPTTSLLLMAHFSRHLWGMSALDVLMAITDHAATALGLAGQRGRLTVGAAADFVIWEIQQLEELSYYVGYVPPHQTVKDGVLQTTGD